MGKEIVFWSIALFLIVQTPLVFSIECSGFSEDAYNTCIDIKNSGISEEEKALLVSNLGYDDIYYPDHDYVYQHSINLDIDDAPSGVEKQSGTYVRDAWMDLIAVMPSVLYNGSIYVPDNAEVISAFDYSYQIPSNYYSSGYPRTSGGDCKRTHSIVKNTAENKVYVNNAYQGSGELVDLDIDSDSEIKIVYSINFKVDIDHYRWDKYCCRYRYRRCVRYCYDCDYSYDEKKTDNIVITDSLDVRHYKNDLQATVEAIDSFNGNSKIAIDYSDSMEVDFADSSFESYKYSYSINYSKEPYYVYNLIAKVYNQRKIDNMLFNEEYYLVKNTDDCTIKAFDFFDNIEKECNLDIEDINLEIITDKLKYKPEETINVNVEPSDIPVSLTYAGETKEATGEATFLAKALNNKIVATYKSTTASRTIFVSDKERFALFWNLSIFGVINYFIYAIVRKYWGVFT